MSGSGRGGGLTAAGGDFFHLVIDYAKQETLGPLKSLGRFLVFGLVGSVALTAGAVLLLLAVLRALQTETGSTFTGHLSWLPYLIVGRGGDSGDGPGSMADRQGPGAPRRQRGDDTGQRRGADDGDDGEDQPR